MSGRRICQGLLGPDDLPLGDEAGAPALGELGDQQAAVCVDGFTLDGISGLETVDGLGGADNETTYRGQLLPLARPIPILLRVRKKEVIFTCQEKIGLKKQLCSELQNSMQNINDRIQAYWWGKTPVI